uniref:NADH-ubiquinone oxidoreductase chain 1 n=1 Tax=Cryptopygus antarcticus TaxID=187623 RepID=B2BSC4_CRYAT|nr:NADH dehydrogenase subunit 1 [Cryptopygus antarcticus]ABS57577.1 NADH dehydrogenase subunit 1 [Cryptopygus antarcticus]
MKEIISLFLSYLILVVGVLISVAFMVLFERKILGYIQIRKGPNKVGLVGVVQSFGDAIKLFIKEQTIPLFSNIVPYYFSPVISLFMVILLWSVFPLSSNLVNMYFWGPIFFCCTSFGVYTLMASGWSSNSNYALLGATRGGCSAISYEVSMALIFLSVIFLVGGYKIMLMGLGQTYIWFFLILFPIFLCWVSSILAETNRTPFDFSEGESELVSGFNIEYGSGGFAFLFLAEYGSIIFMSYLVSVMFMSGSFNLVLINLMGSFFCYWFIWVRGTLPRFRYDKLMYLAWKSFLPVSLNFIMFYFLVSVFT